MNFNSFRKEINSKNASVKELINDIFLKIGSKDIKHTLVRCKKDEPLTV